MSESNKKNMFEELYLQQKKKSSTLMIIVVILAITTAGSLLWGVNKGSSSTQRPPGGFSQDGQGFPGGGGGMGQMDFKRFFKDDGSVDTEAVQEMVDRLPSGAGSQFLDRFTEGINQSAEDGDITQAQADALIKAFESAGGSTNEN